MKSRFDLVKELTALNGIPTQERAVTKYIENELSSFADEITYDNLGSLIAKKGHQGPKIMISAHVDEIGFMVTSITNDGFIKIHPIGGWFPHVLLSQLWQITTSQGQVFGVTGSKPLSAIPAADRSKVIETNQIFLDVGVKSKQEALDLGIKTGQMVTPYNELKALGNSGFITGKALDNRLGVAALIEVFKNIKSNNNQIYAAFTTQEEVGIKGAKTTSFMVRPDIAISLDAGPASDTPGSEKDGNQLGMGPQLYFYDSGLIGHHNLRHFVKDYAEKNQIPYQETYLNYGTTDGSMLQLSGDGAATISIGIPLRYPHSHLAVAHLDDLEHVTKLLKEVISLLDEKTVNQIIFE